MKAVEVDFQREVRPILSDKCFFCHGFDPETREADLRLDTPEGAYEDLGGYAAVVPGKVEESELYRRITSKKKSEIMPTPESHKSLSAKEIEILKKWIEQGAGYEEHWAYQPVKKEEAPEGEEVDHFITEGWEKSEVEGSEQADKATLIRRLSWDLRGVPPTSEETEAFLNDSSPEAWSAQVERFLADPKYGERMAVWWLDLVRYADTIGYHSDNEMKVSPYRDYVINAFNTNKSFDDFTIEQLAGDLLENPTLEQKVASGYNRLLQTTEEGGAQEKEYRAIYAADRVRNVSEVWLGSTIGCAQCHDHKYDPFTAKDFHAMAAFFDDLKEAGIGKRRPNLIVPTAEESARVAQLKKELESGSVEALVKRDPQFRAKIEADRERWLAEGKLIETTWRMGSLSDLKAPNGTKLKIQKDGSVLESGKVPDQASYGFQLRSQGTVAAIRVDAMTDPSFAEPGGFSRSNGNFVLTGVEVKQNDKTLKLVKAEANFEQKDYPASHAIDGKKETGWAVGGHTREGRKGIRQIAFVLKEPVTLSGEESLTVTLHFQSKYKGHTMARFAVAVSGDSKVDLKKPVGPPAEIMAALEAPERSAEQETLLRKYHLQISPEAAGVRNKMEALQAELEKVQSGMRRMLVSEAIAEPRVTRLLHRGNWMDESGEVVMPAVPEFLKEDTSWEIEGRASRLDLAKWILHEKNPLTARSTMNRLWRIFFGRGLSGNVTDLGGQGQVPSHPELLDWLSVDFREGGWDFKRMVRKIVMSEAYQQRSEVDSLMREKDPANELIARQGRWRVEAEFVRDSALQLAGILKDDELGGESVKPYQPDGFWQHLNFPKRTWKQSEGDDLYRRSLYTFWCRSFLHPSMVAFDAPSREECSAERARSNIPQQALAMLNDPIFVEASRVFGARLAQQDGDVRAKIAWGIHEAFSREGHEEEIAVLEQIYQAQKEKFENEPEEAKAFLSTGNWPAPEGLSPEEAAAWGQVGRVILNAYETTSRF